MNQEIIKLKNVCKTYEMSEEVKVNAVCHVDIIINKGDFVAIMGPSGSGKSTTMNLVGALDLATEGDIFLDNINIEQLEESELAQIRGRRIGFIFQNFNLIPNLTAKENIMLPMTFQDYTAEEREERATKLLELVGLEERVKHYPNQLSGGEQQRVAIARALVTKPSLILADEPTGNLDSKAGDEIINLLKDLNKKGNTVVLVTHEREIAMEAKRIIEMKDGLIISDKKIK